MKIDSTKFGSITIDGKEYSHDLYILPDGNMEKRDKSHSPRIHGHRSLGKAEIKHILSTNPDILLIGTGQSGVLPFQEDVEGMLQNSAIVTIKEKTPDIINEFNKKWDDGKRVAAILHVTC
ncbi:hypothetical protein GF325_00485 [Candidatus Bathyarchaeota archaeon]|nr:hypothetical protein [Candidatus Bathyarchaeota archaeon]